MNLGNIKAIACKMEFDARDAANARIDGLADLPMIWWFRDLFDHVVYTQALISNSKGWANMKVEIGPQAKMTFHESRIDELITILGYTFPFDGFLKEKEFSGFSFNWNFVKEIGCFYKGSYDDQFFYKGAQSGFFDSFVNNLKQFFLRFVGVFSGGGNFIMDKVTLRLSEFRFIKDAYVTTSPAVIPNCRTKPVNANRFSDHLTLIAIGEGEIARSKHYPLWSPIDAYTDVRIRVGQNFIAQGPRWKGSPRTMTCAEYTIHEGEDGNRMQVLGYEKFEGTI